jgi:hypothetical protein
MTVRPEPAAQIIGTYLRLLPLLPLIAQAVRAEQEAPGYGADAIMFRALPHQSRSPGSDQRMPGPPSSV